MTSNSGLRSTQWFGATGRSGMAYRGWMRSQGFTPEVFDGRPVIGIATTWSELAPCNVHLHRVAESVKRGVWQAGGFPLEFPAMALGETLLRPTAMLYRNLLAMEAEELMRANPLDGVVLADGDLHRTGRFIGDSAVAPPRVEFFRLSPRDRERFPPAPREVFCQQHQLSHVIGVVGDLEEERREHAVLLGAGTDCARRRIARRP